MGCRLDAHINKKYEQLKLLKIGTMNVTIKEQGLFGSIEAKVTVWGVRKGLPVKKSVIEKSSRELGKRFSVRLETAFPAPRGKALSYDATREFTSSNGTQVTIQTKVSFKGTVGMARALGEIGTFDGEIAELLVGYIDHATNPSTLTAEIALVLATV